MKLNEMLLLEGKTYENYWKQVSSAVKKREGENFTLEDFKETIIGMDPTANEERVGKYTDWIINNVYKKEGEHVSELVLLKALKFFDRNKKEFQYKEIEKYTPVNLVREAESIEIGKSSRKMKGVTPTFEHNGWKIIEVKNHQQACNLGSGTKWCITMREHPEQYNKYKKFGPIFFVVKGNRRWAITGRPREKSKVSFYAWDEQDRHGSAEQWKEKENVPYEVMNYLLRRYNNES